MPFRPLPGTFSNAQSGYAEPPEQHATIAIFDSFAGSAHSTTHGERVEAVIRQRGGFHAQDIQRFHNGLDINMRGLDQAGSPGEFSYQLDNLIVGSQADMLRATSDNLTRVLSDPGSQIRTINQSQGWGPLGMTRMLYDRAVNDPLFRDRMTETLGLPPDADRREFLQALVDRVEGVSSGSPVLAQERMRYEGLSAEADSRGIAHVLSAGNDGDFATFMRRQGIETGSEFFRSVLANDHTTVVGATDDRGTATPFDDRPASFTTPFAGAEVSAPGVNVPIFVDGHFEEVNGTSFSAPAVTALMAQMRQYQPGLSNSQAEALLAMSSRPVGSPYFTGYGEVDAYQTGWIMSRLG